MIRRTWNRLQFKYKLRALFHSTADRSSRYGTHYDVVIAGGGVMGSSSAYFLKNKAPSMKIAIIEKDTTYSQASSALSASSFRQQFSISENIRLSQWSHEFMKNIHHYLSVDGQDKPDVCIHGSSYMFLASQHTIDILEGNCALQRSCGANINCIPAHGLSERFGWLNVDGVCAGSFCEDGREGWFDAWSLLTSFQKKAVSLGVEYIQGECVQLNIDSKVSSVKIRRDNNERQIHCSNFINASGPWAGYLMKKVGIPLPVFPRKRYIFVIDCPKGPGRSMPMLVDTTGVYCRPDGNGTLYICGQSPSEDEEPDIFNLEVDYDYFYETIWPVLAYRIPSMEELKLKHSWAGYYDYNTLDQNGIIGPHPEVENLYFVNGFSGHGIQQSPAVGNAISEVLLDGQYTEIDLSKFGYQRILKNEPLFEINVV